MGTLGSLRLGYIVVDNVDVFEQRAKKSKRSFWKLKMAATLKRKRRWLLFDGLRRSARMLSDRVA